MKGKTKYVVQGVRAPTYRKWGIIFKRGVPETVEEWQYHDLMRNGNFIDPRQDLYHVHPSKLALYDERKRRVVFIRDMGLGDVLMVMPSLRAVHKRYPNIQMEYAVKNLYVPLFQHFEIPTRSIGSLEGRFNAVDLRGYSERAKDRRVNNRIDVFARYMLVDPLHDRRITVPLDTEEILAVRTKLQGLGYEESKPLVALTLRGSTAVRTIPSETIFKVAGELVERGYQVAPVDHAPQHWNGDGIVDTTGQLSIRELACLCKIADVVVAPDTGTYHLANAVGTPAVVVFSTILPDLRVRYYDKISVVWHGNGHPGCPCFDAGCHALRCLKEVSAAEICDKVTRWVDKERNITFEPIIDGEIMAGQL